MLRGELDDSVDIAGKWWALQVVFIKQLLRLR